MLTPVRTKVDDEPRTLLRELQRIKISIKKKEYDQLLRRIQDANIFLQRLTERNLALEPIRKSRRMPKRSQRLHIERSRAQARSLHDALIKGDCWRRGCCQRHIVHIRLDRGWEAAQTPAKSGASRLRLSIYLDVHGEWSEEGVQSQILNGLHCYRGKWRDIEVHSIDVPPAGELEGNSVLSSHDPAERGIITKDQKKVSFRLDSDAQTLVQHASNGRSIPGKQPSTSVAITASVAQPAETTRIQDICTTLSSLREESCRNQQCIGFVSSSKCGSRHEMTMLRVADRAEHKTSTLEYLLQLNAQHHKPGKPGMSRRDRLAMATALASGVLYLESSWLKANWRSRDVVFLNVPSDTLLHVSSHEHPFLS